MDAVRFAFHSQLRIVIHYEQRSRSFRDGPDFPGFPKDSLGRGVLHPKLDEAHAAPDGRLGALGVADDGIRHHKV